MKEAIDSNPELAAELAEVASRFREVAADQPGLVRLLLVDPVRTLADAGLALSPRAQAHIREAYPGFAYGNAELYEQARRDPRALPWLREVRLRRSERKHAKGEA